MLVTAVLAAHFCQADSAPFEDSLSDSGNLFNLTGNPLPKYFNGRLSNRPAWAETYAAQVGDAAIAYGLSNAVDAAAVARNAACGETGFGRRPIATGCPKRILLKVAKRTDQFK